MAANAVAVAIRLTESHRLMQHIPNRIRPIEITRVLVHSVGLNCARTGEQRRRKIEADNPRLIARGIKRRTAFNCSNFRWINHRNGRDGDHIQAGFEISRYIGDRFSFTPDRGGAISYAIRIGRRDRRGVVGCTHPYLFPAAQLVRIEVDPLR